MITRADIDDRVRLWGLREDVVEKDYALGWVLWGIGTDPLLHRTWVFKGGTCLKKCYIETYRFSEDLDFTVLEDGPIEQAEVLETIFPRSGSSEPGIRYGFFADAPCLSGSDPGSFGRGACLLSGASKHSRPGKNQSST